MNESLKRINMIIAVVFLFSGGLKKGRICKFG